MSKADDEGKISGKVEDADPRTYDEGENAGESKGVKEASDGDA